VKKRHDAQRLASANQASYHARMSRPRLSTRDLMAATPGELAVLAALKRLTDKGEEPTMAQIAKECDLSKPGVQGHLTALRLKGKILGPRTIGSWMLTPDGKKALNHP